jgi:DNA-nicking Smr family endonuclease
MRQGRFRPRAGHLTEEERRLWAQVVASVTPLPGRGVPAPEPEPAPPQPPPPAAAAKAPSEPAGRPAPGPARKPAKPAALPPHPPLAAIDRRAKQRIRRGTETFDAVIDLHGLRQADAHSSLNAFLARCQANGARMALVVTGKGGAVSEDVTRDRGVLRRLVPHWLASSEARRFVVGFEEAGTGLGGAGALVVRIRRGGRAP